MKKTNNFRQVITTYYYTNNFGSLFQAICLKNFVEKITNHKVRFNPYQPLTLVYKEILNPFKTRSLINFIDVFKKNIKLLFWRMKNKITFPSFIQKTTKYDLNIYGSDEIWNFRNRFNTLELYFFGHNDNSKKIAYAVSIGSSNFKKLNDDKKKLLKKYLSSFEHISVRDKHSFNFVNDLLNIQAEIVLDPCLLEETNYLDQLITKKNILKNNFVIVYGNVFEEENISIIKKYCSTNNLAIYSLSYFNEWADKNYISIDGKEFLNLFNNAQIVFTSTFHGIIFSCKLKKNFWISYDERKYLKYQSFLENISLENRFINLQNDFNEKINFENIDKKLQEMRSISKQFLINSIERINK